MADTVAIVSIVSGATVAISVPFINARLERRRLDQQTQQARLDELRAVLDRAAQDIYTAWTTLYDMEQAVGTEPPVSRLIGFGNDLKKELDVIVQDGLAIRLRTPDGSAIQLARFSLRLPSSRARDRACRT